MRCEHAFDDGAYVLGALSPGERDRFEKHLATCSRCREAVASLAVLPGLLGRLSPTDVPMALTSEVSDQRLPRLIETATATRKRQRRRTVAAIMVTACAAVFAGLAAGTTRLPTAQPSAGVSMSRSPTGVPMVPMRAVGDDVPVTAAIWFTDGRVGTTVKMKCSYPLDDDHVRPYTFRLVAFGLDGEQEQVSSWLAAAGDEVVVTGTVRLAVSDLARFEVQRKDGETLLVYDVP